MTPRSILHFFLKTILLLSIGIFPCSCTTLNIDNECICAYREMNAESDRYALHRDLNIPMNPLTLEEIVAITINRNLDLLVKAYEYEIQREVLTGQQMRTLPNLIFDLQGSDRNKNTGSSSLSLTPGIPPAPPSISLDRAITQYNLTFMYNLLDFGMAYFKSQEEMNNTYIKMMEFERLRQNLVLDVYKQYWKAIVAKKAVEKGKHIIEKTQKEIQAYQEQKELKTVSLLLFWREQDRLLRMQKQIHIYEKEYHIALFSLGLLMGLPANIKFQLAEPILSSLPTELNAPYTYVNIALRTRPELYSYDFQEDSALEEAKAAIWQMLPGLEGSLATNFNSNSFLIYHDWLSASYRLLWNIFSIPRLYAEKNQACWKRAFAIESRINMTAAVMSQLFLSLAIYHDNLEDFEITSQINRTNVELFGTAQVEYEVGKINHPDLLEFESQAYLAEIEALKSYGESRIALEQINNSIGIPLYICPDSSKHMVIPSYTNIEKKNEF